MADLDPRFARPDVYFVGIGAQKAGTTWMAKYLKRHPQVHVARGKEMHYWNTMWRRDQHGDRHRKLLLEERETATGHRAVLVNRLLGYLENDLPGHGAYADNLFLHYHGQPVVGEVTPGYAQLPAEGFRRIAAVHPNTKFIFLMRDPIERMHSGCRKVMRRQLGDDHVDARSLRFSEDEIAAQLVKELKNHKSHLLKLTRYHQTIRELETAIAPENIHYAFFEHLFTGAEVARLCAFLGIKTVKADFDRKLNVGNPRDEVVGKAFVALAMPHVEEVYTAISARFGHAVPVAWQSHLSPAS